jgi:hypothetical protein
MGWKDCADKPVTIYRAGLAPMCAARERGGACDRANARAAHLSSIFVPPARECRR